MTTDAAADTAAVDSAAVRTLADIPGWFDWMDQVAFEHFLAPDAIVPNGNLVELGAYLGKSAVLMGRYLQPGETFTVCDLFGAAPGDDANKVENDRAYKSLTRAGFEANYLALHDELPDIIEGFSSEIVEHVPAQSVRFLHVDASHLYEHVAGDVKSARRLLLPDAVVVFDDYRSAHTPGVSAAVWEAVFTGGLQPICLTPKKLYATFGDRTPHQDRLVAWLRTDDRTWFETTSINNAPVVRVRPSDKPAPAANSAAAPDLVTRVASLERELGAERADVATLTRRVADLDAARRAAARRTPRALAGRAKRTISRAIASR